ncbi:hypothetical protein B0H10DRAFT_2208498 [Mycena sp. CBHHK59/15]|nr:hypothetical protein B0H10DRAFT_2208498 [Mycena sp. CBHHK59/15]
MARGVSISYRGAKKRAGKREEKEKKEFRLKILVRTVAFMQYLLARVVVLEADPA